MGDGETRLARDDWQRRRAAHAARVRPWVEDRLRRAARGQKHPVYDFLFEYYAFRPAHLIRWSPGFGVRLADATPGETDWPHHFRPHGCELLIPAESFPPPRHEYLAWAVRFLEEVVARPPSFACYGLHEWAMLYRTGEVRHAHVPLRVTPDTIAAVVDTQGLRCTHFDAFRFFSAAARPRNRLVLTRAESPKNDQAGCIHANMDLYKLAFALAPYSSAELTADAFLLAIAAREIDMRASPYDLGEYGFSPIAIETRDGRDEYVHEQQDLASKATTLRFRVLEVYQSLRSAIGMSRTKEKTPGGSWDPSGVC
jgi:hypothetical protein